MTLKHSNQDNSFVLEFLDFSGGLNTRDLDTIIRDNELSDVSNFNYDKRGALKVRPGFTKFGTTAIGAYAVKSIGGYYRTGQSVEVIGTGSTEIYTITSSAKTAIKTGLTGDGLNFDLHQFFNHYYMANGTDAVQVRGLLADGTTMGVWDIGYPIPTSNCSAAQDATAGGLEAKTYSYKITYYYNDGESDSCTQTTSQLAVNEKSIALTSIPIGNTRVTQRKIYRTIGDGSTYKLLTTLSNNTTTTYTDSIADSALGADMDTDNDIPPVMHYVVNHKGRLWGMAKNSSRLYYSKALHPEAFPAANYWDIGQDDGTVGKALTVNLGLLVIFKDYSTWVISGDIPTGTSADMTLENANPKVGCVGFQTMAHAGNDLIFLSPNLGVQRLTRVILASTETMDVESLSDKIDTTIKGLAEGYLQYACAEVYDHKYHLFVPDGENQTTNNIGLVLDLRDIQPDNENTIRWTKYTNMNFASCKLIYDTSGDRLLCGIADTTGYVYDFGSGTTDGGTLISATATTKNHDIDSFINSKTLRSMAIFGRASEDWSFKIRVFTNSRGTVTQTLYSFATDNSIAGSTVMWDTFAFDKYMFDSNPGYTNVVVDFITPKMLTQSSVNLVKFKIESVQANQEFGLYGISLKGNLGNSYIF
jgi:hypothetical protein